MDAAGNQPSEVSVLLRHRPFTFYVGARGFSEFAAQIFAVAVGWHIYAITGSAFSLGLAGLLEFLPTALFIFIAGHVADRFERRRVAQACQLLSGLTLALLAWGTFAGWLTLPQIFAAILVLGVAGAFESPAVAALLPAVAPPNMLQRGTAISTGVFQVAMISGPALGGFAYALSPGLPYAIGAALSLLAMLLNGMISTPLRAATREAPDRKSLFAGVLRTPQPCDAGHDLAGPVCRAFGRRHGAAADLRPRHSAHRPQLASAAARRTAVGALLIVALARSPLRGASACACSRL